MRWEQSFGSGGAIVNRAWCLVGSWCMVPGMCLVPDFLDGGRVRRARLHATSGGHSVFGHHEKVSRLLVTSLSQPSPQDRNVCDFASAAPGHQEPGTHEAPSTRKPGTIGIPVGGVQLTRPTRYLSPVGAGIPPSGSMVTAIATGFVIPDGMAYTTLTPPSSLGFSKPASTGMSGVTNHS
jgi:hypothetical protein